MSVVERIRDALSGETNRVQSSSNERSEPSSQNEPGGESERDEQRGQSERSEQSERNEQSERSEQLETRLYRCDPCDTTYVSDELDACSQCNEPVERIPTERDLGLV